jgi:hypothetical protein
LERRLLGGRLWYRGYVVLGWIEGSRESMITIKSDFKFSDSLLHL